MLVEVFFVMLLDADDLLHRERVDEADAEDLGQPVERVDEDAGLLRAAEPALLAGQRELHIAVLRVVEVAEVVPQRQQRDLPRGLDPEVVQKALLRQRHVRVDQAFLVVLLSEVLSHLLGFLQVQAVEVEGHEVFEDHLLLAALRAEVGLLERAA